MKIVITFSCENDSGKFNKKLIIVYLSVDFDWKTKVLRDECNNL